MNLSTQFRQDEALRGLVRAPSEPYAPHQEATDALLATEQCPDRRKHTPFPLEFAQWDRWAIQAAKTLRPTACPSCGCYAIWVPRVHRKRNQPRP